MHDDSLAAGTAFHIGGAALESPLHNWNTDMRHTLILVHQLRRAMEDEPDSERATRLKSVIDDFESRYDGFATHLRAPSQDGEPTEEWMRIHAERTLELRTSVGQMVPWLPRIPTNTGTAPQSLQPSVTFTAATGNPHPLRLETGQGAGMCSVSHTGAMVNADRSSWDYRFYRMAPIANERRRLTWR